MTDRFRFNDKELDEAIQRRVDTFKSFQTNLDNTSADIRNLEKWLQSCGICFYASVDIGSGEAIAWSDNDGGWRLTCEVFEGPNEHDVNVRPLIEMPVRSRLLARPHLPALVDKIAELVPQVETEPENKKGGGIFAKARTVGRAATLTPEVDLFGSADEIPF